MRLLVILPPVQPEVYPEPDGCPSADCGSHHVQFRQAVRKPLRDTQLHEVVAQRYRVARCGRTFRVYPVGVSHDQTSARLKGVAVMFYVLGMSYGAVATGAGGLGLSVEQGGRLLRGAGGRGGGGGLRREAVRTGGGRVVALGADLTSVRCAGQWLTVGVSVDAVTGTALSVDLLPNGEAATLTAWVQELAGGHRGRGPGQRRCRSVQDGGRCQWAAGPAGLQSPCAAQHGGVGGGASPPP